jgi:hypothetical protein
MLDFKFKISQRVQLQKEEVNLGAREVGLKTNSRQFKFSPQSKRKMMGKEMRTQTLFRIFPLVYRDQILLEPRLRIMCTLSP